MHALPANQRLARRQGFALPAVLTVITALTLVYLAAMLSLKGLQEEARTAASTATFQRAALSTEARIAFFAITEPFGPRSLHLGGPRLDPVSGDPLPAPPSQGEEDPDKRELFIDGRDYAFRLEPNSSSAQNVLQVSIQDEAGLVNLNFADHAVAASAFRYAGADPLLAETLADQLSDYVKSGDIVSLRGAERLDYETEGLAPPPNAPIHTWPQIYGLLGLRRQPSVDLEKLRSVATIEASSVRNVNTASNAVLSLWFGLSDDATNEFVQARADQPISDLSRFGISQPSDEFGQYFFPSGSLRLVISDPGIGALFRSELVLTPDDPNRPFWINDAELARLPDDMRSRENVVDLPELPDVSSPVAPS